MCDTKALEGWWRGYHIDHKHLSYRNITNALLFLLGGLPTILYGLYIVHYHTEAESCRPLAGQLDHLDAMSEAWNRGGFNELMFASPLLLINFLFLVNVDIGFWLIGLVQKSFWLIDPWWTVFPPIYAVLWSLHPLASRNSRGVITMILTFVWSVRLTHSYFRREEWKFGVREDWRYTKMAIDFGRPKWYFISFLAVGISQHPMIVGISLPLYSVRFGPEAHSDLSVLDGIATSLCVMGLVVAFVADNQLREFMVMNAERRKNGMARVPILDTGLWKYSRHPNYFGEQLWWWSLALFSVQVGQWWAISGTFLNSIVLHIVTDMTEGKVLREWEPARADLFREYQRTTSRCIPWPPKKSLERMDTAVAETTRLIT